MKRALLSILAVIASIDAGSIGLDFNLYADGCEIVSYRGNDLVILEGGMVSFEEGQPNLPGFNFTYVIPQGTSVTSVDIQIEATSRLGEDLQIDPVRVMFIGGDVGPDFFAEDIYLSCESFPSSPVVGFSSGSKTGFRLGSFTLVPFEYHPLSRELDVITSATITLHYEPDPSVRSLTLSPFQIQTAISALEGWISNPEMLESWSPSVMEVESGQEEWVVIAREAYLPILQELTDHRTQMGLDATQVSTEWICSNYEGWDSQECIRNYLKESYEERGLVFALIVGDYNQTPMTIRESDFIAYGTHLGEATDLYYSDLDGTWDGDGDHQYGEWEDGLDYYTDIYVGRFPAQMVGELEVMVEKTLSYENDPPAGAWQTRALLCGALLWPEYDYNGDIQCDSIEARIPADWTVDILIEDPDGTNPSNQIDIMNEGVAFIEAVGHGNYAGVWWLEPVEAMFTTGQISSMTNDGMLPLIQSIACHPAHLSHNDCFAEWLLKWSGGGAIAAIFNSSYGIGNCPESGPSEWLNIYFADHLFVNGEYRVGICHAVSKDMLFPTSVPYRRFCMQELILLADPCLYFIAVPTGTGDTQGTEPAAVDITGVFPNPSSGGTCSISFKAPAGSAPVLRVYDLSGRMVREIPAGPIQDGEGSITITPEDADGSNLASGCYLLMVSTEHSRDTVRFVLIR
jgi:hypothetical protein